jgi:hypothetical protein
MLSDKPVLWKYDSSIDTILWYGAEDGTAHECAATNLLLLSDEHSALRVENTFFAPAWNP